MSRKLLINTPRQKRALEGLLERPIRVSDMSNVASALNPRQVILELRRQGFYGIIITRRFNYRDRDGKICRPGEYFIPEQLKPLVREALEKYIAQPLKSSDVKFVTELKDNRKV